MNFSAILDISSFFIGMIINLLLIALICYYFKRKYENLEIAQNEQAKVLYELVKQNQPKVINLKDLHVDEVVVKLELESNSDSDSDSESENENELDNDSIKGLENLDFNLLSNSLSNSKHISLDNIEPVVINLDQPIFTDIKKVEKELNVALNVAELNVVELNEVELNELIVEVDYSKMNIKQLKEILTTKGINSGKLKKNEMIDLIEKSPPTINDEPTV